MRNVLWAAMLSGLLGGVAGAAIMRAQGLDPDMVDRVDAQLSQMGATMAGVSHDCQMAVYKLRRELGR